MNEREQNLHACSKSVVFIYIHRIFQKFILHSYILAKSLHSVESKNKIKN